MYLRRRDFNQLYIPVKCEVINRNEEPKRVKEIPTAPLVLIVVTGLVENVDEWIAE